MKLNFDKSGLTLVFISISGILFHTPGFDFYGHALTYSFDYPINWGYFIGQKIFLPRYLLLSDIYELFSLTSIPIGWLMSSLLIIPAYQIGKSDIYKSLKSEKLFMQFFIFTVSLLFAATNLGILWIVSFFMTNNYFFLIGFLFHPVCVILIFPIALVSLFKREIKAISICLVLFFIYIIISKIKSDLGIPYDVSEYPIRAILTPENLWSLANYAFSDPKASGYKIISLLIVCFLAFILSFKKNRRIFSILVNNYFFKKILYFPVFWSFFISFLLIISIGKKTLLNNIFSYKQFPLTMEITWISKNKLKNFDHYDLIQRKRKYTSY